MATQSEAHQEMKGLGRESTKYCLPEGFETVKYLDSTKHRYYDSSDTGLSTPVNGGPKERERNGTDLESGPPSAALSAPDNHSGDGQSYFNPLGLQRANSIYSLSRASLSSQLSQLTSLQLPQASSLSTSISAIPTSTVAARALTGAAEQIRRWIAKASEVLQGLDAEDDVEWAAAGGREGLGEVDGAVGRFQELISVYVSAIEELQLRKDISTVPADELKAVVSQMERILQEWEKVRSMLKAVKEQVELAMEWEELWNVVLGDIGMEVEDLSGLVFEMEEKRHSSLWGGKNEESANGIDYAELETIVEESPPVPKNQPSSSRGGALPTSPPMSPDLGIGPEDSTLLGLFARMQPLRASLDFLPMRLSNFQSRAEPIFPSSCEELQTKRKSLEKKFKVLEKDAENLRKELGEDRWVLVFRNASKQAQKMCDTVEHSINRLKEVIEAGSQHNNLPALAKKIEHYEAQRTHQGPAIERMLSIIEKGVRDRLTVNGEIIRVRDEIEGRWKTLEKEMKRVDAIIDEAYLSKHEQLRDSTSSIISMDRSAAESTTGADETPRTSPASSIVLAGNHDPITPASKKTSRRSSITASSIPRPSSALNRRHFSMPPNLTPQQQALRNPAANRLSTPVQSNYKSSSPSRASLSFAYSTNSSMSTPRPSLQDSKPRWNSSVNTNREPVIGHKLKNIGTTPSPQRTPSLRQTMSHSTSPSDGKFPQPSPLGTGRERSYSPASVSPARRSMHLAMRERSPQHSPARSSAALSGTETPRSRSLKTRASASHLPEGPTSRIGRSKTGRLSLAPEDSVGETYAEGEDDRNGGVATTPGGKLVKALARPASAMGNGNGSSNGRRTSYLPQPSAGPTASRRGSAFGTGTASGRESSMGGNAGAKDRPKWR